MSQKNVSNYSVKYLQYTRVWLQENKHFTCTYISMRAYIIFLVICLGVLTIPDGLLSRDEITVAEYIQDTPSIDLSILEVQAQIPEQEIIIKEKIQQLPPAVTIAAPFYPQAPDGKWVLPRAQACSEANIILAAYYLKNKSLTKEQFKKEVIELTKIQQKAFGTYIEIPLHDLKSLYDTFYGDVWSTRILENPTLDDIKAQLAQGKLIIVPTAGRMLNNPHFFGDGPRFHTILIRWYDDRYFYTNEVWMMNGENFAYPQDVIMNAMHDLVKWDITQWAKRVLIIEK